MGNRQSLKQAAVKALEQDIVNLDPSALEHVGHSLVQGMEGKRLIHRGLNRDGKPVGYTVDTFAAGHVLVAEYSTEAGYFDAPFTKMCEDCARAQQLAPDLKKLMLVSNQPCRESDWAAVSAAVRSKLRDGIDFEVYDSRLLAERIYEEAIAKNNLTDHLVGFLPNLWKIWAENEISHALPHLPPDYVADVTLARMIEDQLATHRVLAIFGISGTGKSYASISYAQQHKEQFEKVVWIRGAELAGATSLTSVKIAALGVELNLAYRLGATSCLLVIDDWKGDASGIVQLLPERLHAETRVLITCIDSPGPAVASLHMPPPSDEIAAAILGQGVDDRATPEQCEAIRQRVGSHPLTLAIIRDTIRELEIPWAEIIRDLQNVPTYEGRDHTTVLQRILLNHSDGLADELRILRRLGTNAIDSELALSVLGPGGLAKLLRRSLLQKDGRGMCRMHELVHACLQHFRGGCIDDAAVDARLKGYFASHWETASYHFRRSLHIHADTVSTWVNVIHPRPSFETYLFQLTESASKPVQFLEALRTCNITAFLHDREACLSIIEAIEERYKAEVESNARRRILDEGIANLTSGVSMATDVRLQADLMHHRGKFLRWSDNDEAAKADFEDVLKRDSAAFHTHLQLARIKAKAKDGSCSRHVELILNAFDQDPKGVGITLVLAAFAELGRDLNQGLRTLWLGTGLARLKEAVSVAVTEGFSQPYRTLAQLGRYLWYDQPEALIDMAEQVSFPSPCNASDRECFDIAECMKLVGKAYAERAAAPTENQRWYDRAMEYYTRVATPNEFQVTMIAECQILLRQFQRAVDTLDRWDGAPPSMHWWHRRAQALLGVNQLDDALAAIVEALKACPGKRYRTTFLEVKADIEAASDLPNAVATLGDAVASAESVKFKNALEGKLAHLRARFR